MPNKNDLVEAYNDLNDPAYYVVSSQGDIYRKSSGIIGMSETEDKLANELELRIRMLADKLHHSNNILRNYRKEQADKALKQQQESDVMLAGIL